MINAELLSGAAQSIAKRSFPRQQKLRSESSLPLQLRRTMEEIDQHPESSRIRVLAQPWNQNQTRSHFFFIHRPLPRPSGLVLKTLFLQRDDIPIKLMKSPILYLSACRSCFDSSGSGGDANEGSDH
ncbi:MAG: hypothetical protein ACJ0BN_00385 [Limisphaerales bacterium]